MISGSNILILQLNFQDLFVKWIQKPSLSIPPLSFNSSKMKRYISFIILLQLSLPSKAQLSFEKIYTLRTWTQGTDIVEVDSSNIICIGWDSWVPNGQLTELGTGFLCKINSLGDTIKMLFIGNKDSLNYSSWGDFSYLRMQTICRTSDNNLFVTATFAPKNPVSIYESGVLIIKIDQNLDTLWTRQFYTLNSQSLVWWTCQTNDHGYAITGKRTYSFPLANFTYIIRLDSAGNLLYDKNYAPDSPFLRINAQGICQTDDGGFLITGLEDDLNDYSVPFCIRTDSAGNELWRFTIPFNSGTNGAFNITPTQDGNFVFGWCNQIRLPGAIYWMWVNHLSKINSSGNFIWTRDYFSSFDALNLVKEFPDGRLAMYGWYTDTLGSEGRQGMLTICDSSGLMLSMKKYEGNNGLWSLMGGDFTSDGEMIFCGDTYCCNNTSPLGTTSSLWIFKTDSLGYINAIGEVAQDFLAGIHWSDPYPNPSAGNVLLNMDIQLNAGYSKISLDIYDLQSRHLKSIHLQKGKINRELDLSDLANGQYLLVLAIDSYKGAVKRIVIQH